MPISPLGALTSIDSPVAVPLAQMLPMALNMLMLPERLTRSPHCRIADPAPPRLRMDISASLPAASWLNRTPPTLVLLPVNWMLPPFQSVVLTSPASTMLWLLLLVMVMVGAPLAVTLPVPLMTSPCKVTSPPPANRLSNTQALLDMPAALS